MYLHDMPQCNFELVECVPTTCMYLLSKVLSRDLIYKKAHVGCPVYVPINVLVCVNYGVHNHGR